MVITLQLTGPSRHQAVSMYSLVLVLCLFCVRLHLSSCQVIQGTWWSDSHAVAQYTELHNWVRKTGRSILISQPAVPSFLDVLCMPPAQTFLMEQLITAMPIS